MRSAPTEAKPYDFVLFEAPPRRHKPDGHDRWHKEQWTGSLSCELRVLSPLHIGSGLFELVNGQVVRGPVKRGLQFIIPGSSLKGVFRSMAEAISLSCVSKTRASPRDLPPKELQECNKTDQLCVCCHLFGSLGYLGRVRFTDAQPIEQSLTVVRLPALYSPRPDARLYRDLRRLYRGRKFYYHGRLSQGQEPVQAVAPGSRFSFRTDFESLTDAELHLLLTAMGIIDGLKPKIGGGKPLCLGSVEVSLVQAAVQPADARFLSYAVSPRPFTPQEWQRIQGAKALVRADALNRLRSILAYPPTRDCPSRPY